MTERGSEIREERTVAGEGETVRQAFTETLQIGIVVRDLKASIKRYEEYGIGPWEMIEFGPEDVAEVRAYGQPSEQVLGFAATAMVGQVMWELIQPRDEDGIFARFLAEKGEGVHHIAVGVRNFDETMAEQTKRGGEVPFEVVLSGKYSGIRVAYLGTEADLGVLLEVANLSDNEQTSDAT
jgi:methylmalonyl-CoA/ethylmalonyl-CoA epimerase